MRYTLAQIDNMDGHQFEYVVADLLFHNGWRDVEVTQGSGDYGVDVLARRKNVKYGIQCKRYQGNIGVKAVQEAISGTEFYHCDVAAVITNSSYTKQAIKLAQISGVRLFGRDFLEELIENYEDEYDLLDPSNATSLIRDIKYSDKIKSDSSKDMQKKLEKKAPSQKSEKQQTSIGTGCLGTLILFIFLIWSLVQIVDLISKKNVEDGVKEMSIVQPEYEEGSIKKKLQDYAADIIVEKYTDVDIDLITINEDLETEEEGDYIILLHLLWNVNNQSATSKEMIEMYSSDLAARIGKEQLSINEVAVFWTVPYLDNATAKWTYERTGEEMVLSDNMLDTVFMQ